MVVREADVDRLPHMCSYLGIPIVIMSRNMPKLSKWRYLLEGDSEGKNNQEKGEIIQRRRKIGKDGHGTRQA